MPLYTAQGEALVGTPWQVYPRPQMKRDSFLNLNGSWDFTASASSDLPENYDHSILVPFCPESLLSGLHRHFPDSSFLFYRRSFRLPEGFCRGRVLLHIGAADQVLDCYVNQRHIGTHIGGYEAMTFDITAALQEENELVLRVRDDLRSKTLPYGKQTLTRGGMWYTPVSGIWQTVWLESVPETYISRLDIQVHDSTAVIDTGNPSLSGTVTVRTPEGVLSCPLTGGCVEITPDHPRLWCPEDPYLYEFTVDTGCDRVESYFALRTLETKVINGIPRLCLNGKPYFFHGLLDQGYWSDGLFTPAAPEGYAEDILAMKRLGFNTLRKHIKVEPEEFYYQCDKLGMVVFQDMVNNGDYAYVRDTALPTVGFQRRKDQRLHRDSAAREAFLQGMEAAVRQLKNHPCIVYWTIFNEGWGQFDSSAVYRRLRELDSTRWIDSTSGWFRGGETDVDSRHIYFGPWRQLKPSDKPLVLSEFGGYCCRVEGHMYCPEKAYGYRTCETLEAFQADLLQLYRERIEPAIPKGLCAAIYTQVSDVEDEINGLCTYDRKVLKADARAMRHLAARLQDAIEDPQAAASSR